MKKVFLSLAVIAALTVVSCKQADSSAETAVDSTVVAVDSVSEVAVEAVDSTAEAATDSIKATEEKAKEEMKK
jgi:hypothetical protein